MEAEPVVSGPQCHLGWLRDEPTPSPQFDFHCLPPAAPQHLHPHRDIRFPAACSLFLPLSSSGMGFSSLPVLLKRKETAGVCPPQEALSESCLVKLCLVLLPPKTELGRKLNLPPAFYLPEMIYSFLGGGCRGLYDQQQTLVWHFVVTCAPSQLTGAAGNFCPNPFLSRAVPAAVPAGSVGEQPGLQAEQ